MKKYNKDNPPIHGELSLEEFERDVDTKSFPVCDCCEQPIYNPDFYTLTGMCGPCTCGESALIMKHRDEL